MGTYPPRSYGWRVTLDNGATVDEFPKGGPPANRWKELEHDEIVELKLVSFGIVQEVSPVVHWWLEDASLWIRGHRVDVVLGPARITRSPGTLIGPVQRKKASSTHRPGQGSTTRLRGFLVGCQRELEEFDNLPVRALAKVDPQGRVGMRVDAPRPLADARIGLLVDGEPVTSRNDFQRRVGPPGQEESPCP